MLSIFSCPKVFRGHFNIIQRNAMQSWKSLVPSPEIILIGNEEGTAEVCRQWGFQHYPAVKCNEYGTPYMSSIFQIGQKESHYPWVCYVNSAIILMQDFVRAIERLSVLKNKFLAVGRRWDVPIKESLSYSHPSWEEELSLFVKKNGRLEHHSAIDCLLFPKGLIVDFPDFTLGRPLWDNWLIYNIKRKRIPIIDCTPVVTLIHQSHDYSHYHLSGGVWNGSEARANLKLAGGYHHAFTIADADYQLTQSGLSKNLLKYYYSFLRNLKIIFYRFICHDLHWGGAKRQR